jgi:DNA-binding IclR family transcriptional regulator
MLEFSYTITSRLDYQAVVMQIMQRLSNSLGVMVYFGVMHHEYVLYLYNTYPIATSKEFLIRSLMGEKAPLYCTALGKAMLSTLPPEEAAKQLGAKFVRFTPNTLVSIEDILFNVEESGKRGYAIDNCEHEDAIRCIAVPVRNRHGILIGGLCISGPVQQITDELIKDGSATLIAAAFEIRNRL